MKIFLLFTLFFNSSYLLAQETVDQEVIMKENEVPKVGKKAVPQLQEDQGIENPFLIGPYQNGKYQYNNPDRDPDASASSEEAP